MTLIYMKDNSSATTVFHVVVRGGKGAQPPGKDGLAYLTTRMMLEIPDWRKVQKLMELGVQYNLLCKIDYSRINVTCLSENLETSLNIISRIIKKPLISGMRIDKIKKEMLRRRGVEEDRSSYAGHNRLLSGLFGDTVVGRALLGSEETHRAIQKKDIQNYYRRHFCAKNMTIVVASDLEERIIFDLMEKYFSRLPSGEKAGIVRHDFSGPAQKEFFIEKDTEQTLVSMGCRLPELNTRNFVLAFLMETLLGSGVGSRLWPLRVEKKLCYDVNAAATHMMSGGLFEAYLETDKDKLPAARAALEKIFEDLFAKGIGSDEFETTRAFAESYLIRGFETKSTKVQNVDFFEMSGIDHNVLGEFGKITLDEFNGYLKKVLDPQKAVWVTVGPK
jgi:predicted Zn-dependent peptidase